MLSEMTIEEYLRGLSPLLTEDSLRHILVRRGIDEGTLVADMTERDLDLAEGTAYYLLSNLQVGGSAVKDNDGDWSHSEGSWQVSNANIAEWKAKYKALFSKWDELPLDAGPKIKIVNFN